MNTNLEKLKSTAEELIEKYALTIPVHVFQLADLLGISWKTCTTNELKTAVIKRDPKSKDEVTNWQDVLGYYDLKTESILLNNETQPMTRKRFTMAHEIGHKLLHHDLHKYERSVFMRHDILTPRDTQEAEANYFAAYLLMPDKDITTVLSYTKLMTGGEEIIKALVKMFGVSDEALRIRLKTFKKEHPEVWQEYELEKKLF
ncbi:MAG: ImmA/IrrE family metallo-endopeptidase [Weeksellaceae bacterium]